jgi:hypothetical protein
MRRVRPKTVVKPVKRPDEYPWVVEFGPGVEPRVFKTRGDAVKWIMEELNGFSDRLQRFDGRVPALVESIKAQVQMLPPDGGSIDGLVDEHTQLRFKATLQRRSLL